MKLTHRPYKIGRLYFRYIANTPDEKRGWNAEMLASALEQEGFIRVVDIQGYDSLGRWTPKVKRYFELKPISRTTILDVMRSVK